MIGDEPDIAVGQVIGEVLFPGDRQCRAYANVNDTASDVVWFRQVQSGAAWSFIGYVEAVNSPRSRPRFRRRWAEEDLSEVVAEAADLLLRFRLRRKAPR